MANTHRGRASASLTFKRERPGAHPGLPGFNYGLAARRSLAAVFQKPERHDCGPRFLRQRSLSTVINSGWRGQSSMPSPLPASPFLPPFLSSARSTLLFSLPHKGLRTQPSTVLQPPEQCKSTLAFTQPCTCPLLACTGSRCVGRGGAGRRTEVTPYHNPIITCQGHSGKDAAKP